MELLSPMSMNSTPTLTRTYDYGNGSDHPPNFFIFRTVISPFSAQKRVDRSWILSHYASDLSCHFARGGIRFSSYTVIDEMFSLTVSAARMVTDSGTSALRSIPWRVISTI